MNGARVGGTGVATALAAAGTAVLCAVVWSLLALTHPAVAGVSENYFIDGLWLALGLTFTLAGLFLVVNGNGRGMGVLMLATGLLQTLRMVVILAAALVGAGPTAVDAVTALVLATGITNAFMVVAFPLWLPDARLPGGIWRSVTVLVALWSALLAFSDTAGESRWSTLSNPLHDTALHAWLDRWLSPYVFDVFTASLALTLTVAAVRWWHSPGPHPHLPAVVAAYVVWAALIIVPHYVGDYPGWLPYAVLVAGEAVWMLVPVTAFRRDRQLSLDRVTRRYLAACAYFTLVFIAVLFAVYLMHRLQPGTGGGTRWWQVVTAGVLGALLRPAARVVGRAVDRYYYGERAHPYQLIRQLAERMSHAVNPADAPPLLCRTVVQALGLPAAGCRGPGTDPERAARAGPGRGARPARPVLPAHLRGRRDRRAARTAPPRAVRAGPAGPRGAGPARRPGLAGDRLARPVRGPPGQPRAARAGPRGGATPTAPRPSRRSRPRPLRPAAEDRRRRRRPAR
ncbi:hypothetical protein [Kitasatospora sp. NPDC056184]|uniref:hypothetical protein n=1 Tax=Kitasatospora sp. NPDC056184 TaxID=3345738 RepID=UPI0035DA2B57